MSQETIDTFMAITSAENSDLAKHFVEMAGGNLETAISLFFEHGGNAQLNNRNPSSNPEELAEQTQLFQQQEEDNYRAPDEARHETLVDTHVFPSTFGGIGGRFEPLRNIRGMFDDSRPQGVFNQRIGDNNEEDSEFSEEENYRQDYEYTEETVMELDDDGNVREYTKLVRKPREMTKEQKLAMLFRPPFDMMAKIGLDDAKLRGREKQKWIMINIQTVDIFQCQALNRDVWANKDVKKLVRDNFVFLQYQFDSQNAQPYIQFYGPKDKEELPHVAILDPITGERVKQWNRDVPNPLHFIQEVEDFLSQFSLQPGSTNPTVKESTPKLDPTLLSEEQQMELAIQESLNRESSVGSDTRSVTEAVPQTHETEIQSGDPHMTLFDSIAAQKHQEPANQPGITTRIQIRTGDGRRLVRRFNAMEDTVRTIFEVVKGEVDGFESQYFTLSDHARENLLNKLDETISDAGLKNSSLLLELVQD
ncbi:LANO_0B05446g1_1 [Lachancea nothofagi CBS 11611]|uniref:LANO_0B05446g1_1 n=1 Tax=Lachancea nothofagi CBS 11611 TaxID=1266666 RepID=A0A1G4IYJ7_9SACH|nr:LANO_0B05446g1_1 [Lachancea nothofagi CBS 11611]